MSVNDGQHRLHALLSGKIPKERLAQLMFPVQATQGLSFEQHLRIFKAQNEGMLIDPRLILLQDAKLGEWKNPVEQRAFAIVKAFGKTDDSPLKGQVFFGETVKRRCDNETLEDGVNAKSLFDTVYSLINSHRGVLRHLAPEDQQQAIFNVLGAARETWSAKWRSPKHRLGSAQGIQAILLLLGFGTEFRSVIDDHFADKSVVARAIGYVAEFTWTVTSLRHCGEKRIMELLDREIAAGKRRTNKK